MKPLLFGILMLGLLVLVVYGFWLVSKNKFITANTTPCTSDLECTPGARCVFNDENETGIESGTCQMMITPSEE